MAGDTETIERVLGLIDDESPDARAMEWIRKGIRRCLESEGLSLEQALGLNCVHSSGWRYLVRKQRRDQALRRALVEMGGDFVGLGAAIARFQGSVWPRWRQLEGPPTDGSRRLYRAIDAACRSGLQVPCSARHLRRLLGRTDAEGSTDLRQSISYEPSPKER